MNLQLLSAPVVSLIGPVRVANPDLLRIDPFSNSFPENFDTSVDAAALCARFNPRGVFAGHYLAVGRMDGIVSVLDFETKNIVRWLEGHVKAVTSVWCVSPHFEVEVLSLEHGCIRPSSDSSPSPKRGEADYSFPCPSAAGRATPATSSPPREIGTPSSGTCTPRQRTAQKENEHTPSASTHP